MRVMKAQTVQLNDIEMHYESEGVGEPLLLLHGGTGCLENWFHAGRDLFLNEYTLIKPDARGHGRTTNPQRTITHRQCALDTLGLLDLLGIRKCRAIGVSMGGKHPSPHGHVATGSNPSDGCRQRRDVFS